MKENSSGGAVWRWPRKIVQSKFPNQPLVFIFTIAFLEFGKNYGKSCEKKSRKKSSDGSHPWGSIPGMPIPAFPNLFVFVSLRFQSLHFAKSWKSQKR